MKINEALSEIKAISNIISDVCRVEMRYENIDDNEIINIAEVNSVKAFTPSLDIPYYWCVLEKDNIRVVFSGVTKIYKLIN